MVAIKMFFSVAVCTALILASGVPVEDMSPGTLGIEYKGMLTGQTITKAEVASTFKAHYCMLRYAPIPYLLVSFGVGGSHFSVEEYDSTRFTGKSGVSTALGLNGFSPVLINLLVVTAGVQAYLLNSSQQDYRYTAGVINPSLGLRILLGGFTDIEAGVRGQVLVGTMKRPSDKGGNLFANNNYPRGYLAAILHSASGVYATFAFDVSPLASSDLSGDLNEASLSFQIGFLLSSKRFAKKGDSGNKNINYFKEYENMKKECDNMANDL